MSNSKPNIVDVGPGNIGILEPGKAPCANTDAAIEAVRVIEAVLFHSLERGKEENIVR